MPVKSYKEGIHYIMDGDRVVFTALFHIQRGHCCGNGCLHCPFEPHHKKGTTDIQQKYLLTQKDIVIFNSKKGYDKTQRKRSQ